MAMVVLLLFQIRLDTPDGFADTQKAVQRRNNKEHPMGKHYSASKSRGQGRDSWSVIFRHPVRLDPNTGKPGRRVRRGLGTADDAQADALVAQLNQLLSTETYWAASARPEAETRFNTKVIEIFFDGVDGSDVDYLSIRDDLLPMPETHRKVLLLGTTGAGKTTVVRQILGTDPVKERFPSTSTAKTTIADTELILSNDPIFRAVVTFAGRDEVTDRMTDNVSEAALAAFRGESDADILRRLLDHVNQRFRFSYVFGRPSADDDDLADDEPVDDIDAPFDDEIDLTVTHRILEESVDAVKSIVATHRDVVRDTLVKEEEDERVIEEVIEDNLDMELRRSEEFHRIVDSLLDEVEKRFAVLDQTQVSRNRQGWPVSWTAETQDRAEFIKVVMRFSSNYAAWFGRLLTPLVNGIRVQGAFMPTWATDSPNLVIIDGEGLGHTPNSAATLSTSVAKRIEQADVALLVDNAAQPMQAAPVAAMKAITASGNSSKLVFLFTHFDQVKGDNLPTFSDRESHVLASVENVLSAIGDDLGPIASRSLGQRLERARYFVGSIQDQLDSGVRSQARSIQQLDDLLTFLARGEEETPLGTIRPVYDRMNLSLAVAEAARSFHSAWDAMLGIEYSSEIPKEHWTRVKALSRRLAEGWADEYDTLKPVADLRYQLQLQIYLMLQRPVRWEGGEPTDDEKRQLIDEMSNAITQRLFGLTQQRIRENALRAWQDAYAQSGTGSTFVRARIIASEIYDRGVPIPTVAASPDQNQFLRSIAEILTEVADDFEVVFK